MFAAVVLCKYRNKHFIGFTAQDKQWIATIIALNVGLSVVFGGSIGHW